jgi:hypothetical protein
MEREDKEPVRERVSDTVGSDAIYELGTRELKIFVTDLPAKELNEKSGNEK